MGDLLDDILNEMKEEGIEGQLKPMDKRLYWREQKRRLAADKLEGTMKLIEAAKNMLATNPYVGPHDCCIHCGRLRDDSHTDDCAWLHLNREVQYYVNRFILKRKEPTQ